MPSILDDIDLTIKTSPAMDYTGNTSVVNLKDAENLRDALWTALQVIDLGTSPSMSFDVEERLRSDRQKEFFRTELEHALRHFKKQPQTYKDIGNQEDVK